MFIYRAGKLRFDLGQFLAPLNKTINQTVSQLNCITISCRGLLKSIILYGVFSLLKAVWLLIIAYTHGGQLSHWQSFHNSFHITPQGYQFSTMIRSFAEYCFYLVFLALHKVMVFSDCK